MAEDLALSGTLKQRPFPSLLLEIKKSGRTGILLVKKGETEKRIFFQNGEPIASRSNVRQDLLGEILCTRGKISRAELDEAILEAKKGTGENFGQILIRKEFLTPKALYSECKYQFISILFSTFAEQEGTYTFQDQEASSLLPQDLPRFHVRFSKLLSEGIRLIKQEDFIDKILGSTAQEVAPTGVTIPFQELSFKGEEKGVLESLGEAKTIQEILDTLSLDPSLIKKILYTLSCLNVVEIHAPGAAPTKEEKPVPVEVGEDLPELSESSLSEVMSDLLPEDRTVEDPALEQESPEPLEVEEATPFSPEIEMESEEPPQDLAEKIQVAVDKVGDDIEEPSSYPPAEEETPVPEDTASPTMDEEREEALPEVAPESATDDQDLLAAAWGKELEASGLEEEEPPEGEEPPSETPEAMGDEITEGMSEKETVEEVSEETEETLPPEQEEILSQAVEKEADTPIEMDEASTSTVESEEESQEEKEEALPPEQEEILPQAVEKEVEETEAVPEKEERAAPVATPVKKKTKKRLSLIMVASVLTVIMILGGMALFYFIKAKESRTMLIAKAAKEVAPPEMIEVREPSEMIQELLKEDIPEKISASDEKKGTSEPAPVEQEAVKEKGVGEDAPSEQGEQKSLIMDAPKDTGQGTAIPEEVTPSAAPAPSDQTPGKDLLPEETVPAWADFYAEGLTNFLEGNLKSAFHNWSDVIRSAPGNAYAIQIEITSYLNFASKDIQEASPSENVFIIATRFNEKPAYKVLCGIYETRSEAKKALQDLSPYLKKQKPALVRLDRLKKKLID